MATKGKPNSGAFTGIGSAVSGTQTSQQALGTLLNPTYSALASPSRFTETPANSFFSPNPTDLASAWDLPPNQGSLRLPSGVTTKTPVSPKAASAVQDTIAMLDLYGKFEDGGRLNSAEQAAAQRLGGPVARAAQLSGSKGSAKATVEAQNEIVARLKTTAGLSPKDLSAAGLDGKVPKAFSTVMQNAGYGVTTQMTFKQALAAMSGPGAQAAPTTVSSGQTVSQYLQNLSQLNGKDITSLQAALYNGGFYDQEYYAGEDSSSTKPYTQGVLDVGTKLAMRTAILQTLQDNKDGKQTSLEDVIGGGVNGTPLLGTPGSGSQSGAPAASGGLPAGTTGATPTVPLATNAQTQQPLINAFTSALGRAPSESELAAFTSTYQNELESGSKTLTEAGENPSGVVDYSTGIPFVQGTPTVSAAATNYAENTDSTEYQAHNIANAFGLLMNLVDRQGASSLNTLGTRPTTTT